MSKKQQEEKHLKMLRQMLTLPDNKKCMDCKEKGPFYACTTFGTFVCPTCSGIHREFGHRVKSISMATFSPEEIKFLQEMGNGNASDSWLATWSPSDYPEPDAGDKERIKDFMHKKYIQKVWYRKPGSEEPVPRKAPRARGRAHEATPHAEPLETILGKDIPPIQITHNVNVNVSSGPHKKDKPAKKKDLLWEDPVPAIPPHHNQPTGVVQNSSSVQHAPPSSSGLSGLESLFSSPVQTQQPQQWAPPAPAPTTSAPLAGPLPQITTEMFQQMNPQQQQQYLMLQQQWLQQQQLLLQQRMSSAGPFVQPATAYPSSLNPFTQPQVPQGYSLPQVGAPVYPTHGTVPSMGSMLPAPTPLAPTPQHTGSPLIPSQPVKEVKKEDTSSHLFSDLSPIGKSSVPTTSSAPAPTISQVRASPYEFGGFQSAPMTPQPPQQQSQSNSYNPFGF